jgi:hypothetical protein
MAGVISIEMISQSRRSIHSQPPGFSCDRSGRDLWLQLPLPSVV